MLKGFKVMGMDGSYLEFYETIDKQTLKVSINHGDSVSTIELDKNGVDDVANVNYKLDVNYPVEGGE